MYTRGGARYNFSSVNIFGTATAADSLAAIKRLVFDERRLTLAELREILKADWSGHEKLRLICRQRMPKYGCGDSEVDRIASELLHSTRKSASMADRMAAAAASAPERSRSTGGSNTAAGRRRRRTVGTAAIRCRRIYARRTAATAAG